MTESATRTGPATNASATTTAAKLAVADLHLSYGDNAILKGVSMQLRQGEVVSLLGPSGSGKTTLLRAVAGLEVPHRGTIRIEDRPVFDGTSKLEVPAEKRNLGLVFQSYALWPHKTVFDNVAYGLRLRKVGSGEIRQRVDTALKNLGLGQLGERLPHQLSGGQQQRVAIARALVYNPPVILMDEPLSNLDAKLREEARAWLRELILKMQLSALVVTHDQNEAMALADHIVVMNQGEILQADDPGGIYNFPSCMFVARFIGRPAMNFLPIAGAVRAGDETVSLAGSPVTVPRIEQGSAAAVLGVRPEHVQVGAPGEGLAAEVRHVEYFGSHWIAELATAAGTLKALIDKSQRPALGDRVAIGFNSARSVLFDIATEQLLASATTRLHREARRHGQH